MARIVADVAAEEPVETALRIDDLDSASRQIALLREEVADLRARLSTVRAQTNNVALQAAETHPWLRIAGTVAFTFVLGKLVQHMRLGAAGAAAVPLIVAQANGRIWPSGR